MQFKIYSLHYTLYSIHGREAEFVDLRCAYKDVYYNEINIEFSIFVHWSFLYQNVKSKKYLYIIGILSKTQNSLAGN